MKAKDLIGWNIKRLRMAQGLSQEALADAAEIDRAHVGKIERGEANSTVDVLDKLALALGAETSELLKRKRPGARLPKPLKKGPKGNR